MKWLKSESEENGNGLRALFVEQLKDIYYAERQIAESLPEMRDSANSPELRQAFDDHLAETHEHVARVEAVFAQIGMEPVEERCPAINGIISEAKDLMKLDLNPAAHDAALVCAAQKVEHYEIGTYGCLRAFADLLAMEEASELITRTLMEEKTTDERLTALAETELNPKAAFNTP